MNRCPDCALPFLKYGTSTLDGVYCQNCGFVTSWGIYNRTMQEHIIKRFTAEAKGDASDPVEEELITA